MSILFYHMLVKNDIYICLKLQIASLRLNNQEALQIESNLYDAEYRAIHHQ